MSFINGMIIGGVIIVMVIFGAGKDDRNDD